MAISVGGIGSGLDVSSIVGQLMALERQPLVALQQKQAKFTADLSSIGSLKGSLSGFEGAISSLTKEETFTKLKAISSEDDAFTVSADASAVTGNYNIEVLSTAKADKKYAVTASAYAGEQGVFTLTSGTNSFSITIDASNNTLEGIRDAINGSVDNESINASIITDNNGDKQLILSAKQLGSANAIGVAYDSGDDIPAVLGFATVTGFENLDASIKIDGFQVDSSSNTFSDVIAGVDITVLKQSTGTQNLTVELDEKFITGEITKFVTSYNGVKGSLSALGGETGAMSGDSTLLAIERGLRSVLNLPAKGDFGYLSEIGITTKEDGTLAVDATKLADAVRDNRDGVMAMFADETSGFAVRMESVVKAYTDSESGLLKSREDGINSSISLLESRAEALTRRLASVEKRLNAQFTALDTLVSQLNNTSTFLSQQLAGLPSAGSL